MTPISRRISKIKKEEHLPLATQLDEPRPVTKILRTTGHLQPLSRRLSIYGMGPTRKILSLSILDKSNLLKSPELEDSARGTDNEVNVTTNRKSVTEDDLLLMASMSTNCMKKFLDEEAERYLASNAPEIRRKRKIKKLLAKYSFPELVVRSKTTSAIFKEYQTLKGNFRSQHSKSVLIDDNEDPKDSKEFQHKPM